MLAAALLLLSIEAGARVRVVDPGETPTLGAEEGLLLVAVDSNVDLNAVSVKKEGRLLSSGVLSNIKAGRSARLYVVPAGQYEWEQIRAFNSVRYVLKDDPEYRFEVRPGVITYGGDLVFRPQGWFRASVHVANRGLRAMDWLEAQHPAVARQYAFTYSGHYPDPFPAFYRAARAAGAPGEVAELGTVRKPPAPGTLPLAIRELWRDERIGDVSLNGAGDLLAERVRDKDEWGIDLIDLKAGTSVRLAQTPFPYVSMTWSGDRTLLVGTGAGRDAQTITIIRIRDLAGGQHGFEILKLRHAGRVLDPLPHDPDHILFASHGHKDQLLVHEIDISSQRALDGFNTGRKPLNKGVADDVAWFTDGAGRLRAALARRDDDYVLLHGTGTTFTEVLRLQAEDGFEPRALSWDGDLVYGLTDEGRAQRDLVVFDPAQRRVTATLFSKPGVDLVGPIMDDRRRPIGAAYYEGGRLVSEYFDQRDQKLAGMLRNTFANRTVAVIDRSRDGQQLVLWVDGSDQPGKLYHLDATRNEASLLDDARPWLEGKRFVASEPFSVKGGDGLPVEAYLTLPPGEGRRPLVVMPHGGPVGVSDRRHFNPQVQFLASLGYAVLQVNFRGSDGYGKAFREAGYRSWGTLIEDDIDIAIRDALARHPLDPQRLCVVGASYGGYSALVAAIRWPERVRCAVSIAGVSDRVLFFTASDAGHSAKGREQLERVIGDPRTQLEAMQASSPLYRYRELKAPVMLVHGEEDTRVDYEHARRLVRMLNLAGRPPVMLTFEDEGHGIDDIDHIEAAWSGIAGFLREHLDTPASP